MLPASLPLSLSLPLRPSLSTLGKKEDLIQQACSVQLGLCMDACITALFVKEQKHHAACCEAGWKAQQRELSGNWLAEQQSQLAAATNGQASSRALSGTTCARIRARAGSSADGAHPCDLVSLLPRGMRARGECKPPRQLLTAPGGRLDAANAPVIAGLPPAVDYLGFPKMTYD